MYNTEVKERYLETIKNENTRKSFRHRLEKAEPNEIDLGKDLYEFTRLEIENVILDMELPSINAVASTVTVFKSYIAWASGNGYVGGNINPLGSISSESLFKLVDHGRKQFLSEDELIKIEKDLINNQDMFVYRAMFEGIQGKEMIELTSLMMKDFNSDTNEVTIRAGETPRTIKVSERLISIAERANRESEYEYAYSSRPRTMNLIDNVYILRGVDNGRVKEVNAPVRKDAIYTRIGNLKKFFDLPYLTPNSLMRSGMIKEAKDIYVETGEITNEDIRNIAYKYGYVSSPDKFDLNRVNGIRQFVNVDNIKKLYEL